MGLLLCFGFILETYFSISWLSLRLLYCRSAHFLNWPVSFTSFQEFALCFNEFVKTNTHLSDNIILSLALSMINAKHDALEQRRNDPV